MSKFKGKLKLQKDAVEQELNTEGLKVVCKVEGLKKSKALSLEAQSILNKVSPDSSQEELDVIDESYKQFIRGRVAGFKNVVVGDAHLDTESVEETDEVFDACWDVKELNAKLQEAAMKALSGG